MWIIIHNSLNDIIKFINSLPEDVVSEELEEAANKFAVSDSPHFADERAYEILIEEKERVFKAGAKWQKEQMMKDAFDATLLEGHLIRQSDITHPLHNGDKVKVIIVS